MKTYKIVSHCNDIYEVEAEKIVYADTIVKFFVGAEVVAIALISNFLFVAKK